MPFKLERERTKTSPYVLINEEKKYMLFEGECYLEETVVFFKDINDWLEKFFLTDFEEFTFDCAMAYFNSSTTKLMYNIFRFMDKNTGDKNVVINWIVADKDDEMLIECGEDFREEMENLEFNIVISE